MAIGIDPTALLQGGAAGVALSLGVAFAIGAAHALEPGHAKTLIAGFVTATRGTKGQAVLLGASAAVSHSLVVWLVVGLGLLLRDVLILDRVAPYLSLLGGAVTLGIAWMLWRSAQAGDGCGHAHGHRHAHAEGHIHHAGNGCEIGGEAQGAPSGDGHRHDAGGHEMRGHETWPTEPAAGDRHQERAGDSVVGGALGWRGIVAVGFTGGLMPCPGAVAVLFLCLQSGAVGLGFATVSAFSLGLAVVLVGVGLATSLALAGAVRTAGWDHIARRAQDVSPIVTALAGLYLLGSGLAALA